MTPGAMPTAGRVYSSCWPSAITVPQLASGGCTPIERNDSADSVMIVAAASSGSSTTTVGSTFGRISEKISRRRDAP